MEKSAGFCRWCTTLRITGFLDLENTRLRILDLFLQTTVTAYVPVTSLGLILLSGVKFLCDMRCPVIEISFF
jgi:hypothetical protein